MAQSALITVMTAAVRKAARGVVRDFGEIEKLAFGLKPNELSSIVPIQEGHLMMLCVNRIPARTDLTLDTVDPQSKMTAREFLSADLKDKKQKIEMGNLFGTMRAGAKIQDYFKNEFEAETLKPAALPTKAPAAGTGAAD